MYAQRKQWTVDVIKVKVDLVKGDQLPSGNNTFFCEITLTGELDDTQRARMLEIAKACPIHRLLNKPSEIVTIMDGL
jgi:putative redox protein